MNQEKGFRDQVQLLWIPQFLPLPHPIRDIWLLLAGSAYPEDTPPAKFGGQSYKWDQREWPSLTA